MCITSDIIIGMDNTSPVSNLNYTVNIVEDDQQIREVLVKAIKKEGYRVNASSDGAAGYKMAEKEKPSIILLDLLLPKMSGKDFLAKLRKSDWGALIPVIILTNLSGTQDINDVLAQGPASYYDIKADSNIDNILDQIKDIIHQT